MDSDQYVVPPLYTDLANMLSGDMDASHQATGEHARDNSAYVIPPHIVAFPKNTTDIKKILGSADEYRIPVAVQGARQNTSGAGLAEGIVIDTTKYMNRIEHVDPLLRTMRVEPGTSCKKIRDYLAGWSMEIPFLTEEDDLSTIGGVVATKSVSATSHSTGGIQSYILGITIILANGEQHVLEDGITPSGTLLSIYNQLFPLLSQEVHTIRGAKPRCVEDPSGYNIWGQSIGPRQLINHIVGSQGTLAIISNIKFQIVPKKAHKETILIGIPAYTDLHICVEIVKHHGAHSISMYDTLLEQLVDTYTSSDEALTEAHVLTLLITLEDNDKRMLQEKVTRLLKALPLPQGYGRVAPTQFRSELFTQHSHIKKLLSAYTKNVLVPVATSSGMIIPLKKVASVLDAIDTYHTKNHLLYSIAGNIGSGHISITTLIEPHHETFAMTVARTTEALFTIAKQQHGSISAGSGDGMMGTPYLSQLFPPKIIELFKTIKDIWDPHAILNSGKKQTLTQTYLNDRMLPPRA